MKALFDTNVLISAFLTEGLCSKLLLRGSKGEFEHWTCPFILKEFEKSLKSQFLLAKAEIDEAIALIEEISQVANPHRKIGGVCRDADDNAVLACAVDARVDYIVSGDKDLLIVAEYEGVKIVDPRSFELLFE